MCIIRGTGKTRISIESRQTPLTRRLRSTKGRMVSIEITFEI